MTSLHTAATFLHVLAALLLVGHGFATPLVLAAIRDAPTTAVLRPWLLFARDSARFSPPAALVLLATGVWLGAGRWGEGWLWASTALWFVNSALAVRVVGATGQRLGALLAAAGDAAIPPEADALRRSDRWVLGAWAMIAVDVATLVLMYVQPGLLASLAIVAGSFAAVLGLRTLRGRRAAASAPGVPSAA